MLIMHELNAAPGIGFVEVDPVSGIVRAETANVDGGIDIRERLASIGFPVEGS